MKLLLSSLCILQVSCLFFQKAPPTEKVVSKHFPHNITYSNGTLHIPIKYTKPISTTTVRLDDPRRVADEAKLKGRRVSSDDALDDSQFEARKPSNGMSEVIGAEARQIKQRQAKARRARFVDSAEEANFNDDPISTTVVALDRKKSKKAPPEDDWTWPAQQLTATEIQLKTLHPKEEYVELPLQGRPGKKLTPYSKVLPAEQDQRRYVEADLINQKPHKVSKIEDPQFLTARLDPLVTFEELPLRKKGVMAKVDLSKPSDPVHVTGGVQVKSKPPAKPTKPPAPEVSETKTTKKTAPQTQAPKKFNPPPNPVNQYEELKFSGMRPRKHGYVDVNDMDASNFDNEIPGLKRKRMSPTPSSIQEPNFNAGNIEAIPIPKNALVPTDGRVGITDADLKKLFDTSGFFLGLKGLAVSKGQLMPPFDPTRTSYTVQVPDASKRLSLIPQIDLSRNEYKNNSSVLDPNRLPIVSFLYPGRTRSIPEATSLKMKKDIMLPESGADVPIKIKLASPFTNEYRTYSIRVQQKTRPPLQLIPVEGYDSLGQALTIKPDNSSPDSLWHVYVDPEATDITVDATCSWENTKFPSGISTTVTTTTGKGKKSYKVGQQPLKIPRDKTRHTQVIEYLCKRNAKYTDSANTKKFALLVNSDWADIPPPRVYLNERGLECTFDAKKSSIECPEPIPPQVKGRKLASEASDADKLISLQTFSDPTIRYTLTDGTHPFSPKSISMRLLNKESTLPFKFARTMRIDAVAGQKSNSWPVHFGKPSHLPILSIIGWIIAGLLAILLLSLLIVIGLCSVCGLGHPVGATEIAGALTLIIQYLTFSNLMRSNRYISDILSPLRWVTLHRPIPTQFKREYQDITGETALWERGGWEEGLAGGITSLWASTRGWLDDLDLLNAKGCYFWSGMILLVWLVIHGIVLLKFHVFEAGHTVPHRVSLGNWESRLFHWLSFPVSVASGMILVSKDATMTAKIIAASCLVFLILWVLRVIIEMNGDVSNSDVCWIWNSSIREAGDKTGTIDQYGEGYWADLQPDQLLTQPVNRAIFSGIFPYKWISTVADIEPLILRQANKFGLSRGMADGVADGEIWAPDHMARGHIEASYPLAKNPQVIEVVNTRRHGGCCHGDRLISGLFRTQWLDLLMTYAGLCKIFTHLNQSNLQSVNGGSMNGGSVQAGLRIPLIVKTSQLSGPLTGGRNAFFYDGVRIPFIRSADFLYRILIGVLMGAALAVSRTGTRSLMFGLIALLSFGFMLYVSSLKPFNRKLENGLYTALLATIGLCATAFCFTNSRLSRSDSHDDKNLIADIFLWVVLVMALVLTIYSLIVTLSVFSAIFCPPLDETRFLEKLANCSVNVIGKEDGDWCVEVPAYSKYPVRNVNCQLSERADGLKAYAYSTGEEATLEVYAEELRRSLRSGLIQPPVCIISDKNRKMNIFDAQNLQANIRAFLADDPVTARYTDIATDEIMQAIAKKGRNGKNIILCHLSHPPTHQSFDPSYDRSYSSNA